MSGRDSCTVQARRAMLGLCFVTGLTAKSLAATNTVSRANTPPHTVTWYADNQRARARMQLACLDNPGQLRADPDCINAHAASVSVAVREGRLRTGEMNPGKVQYWIDDPDTRRNQLVLCHLNPKLDHCDVARRSLLVEAGATRR